ncbi:hypothetical protein FB451DRAFT_1370188 [Mycena latifolia]|nr:hypothetical protein FB451DRAFT_1370188 [Mycena latifolia]
MRSTSTAVAHEAVRRRVSFGVITRLDMARWRPAYNAASLAASSIGSQEIRACNGDGHHVKLVECVISTRMLRPRASALKNGQSGRSDRIGVHKRAARSISHERAWERVASRLLSPAMLLYPSQIFLTTVERNIQPSPESDATWADPEVGSGSGSFQAQARHDPTQSRTFKPDPTLTTLVWGGGGGGVYYGRGPDPYQGQEGTVSEYIASRTYATVINGEAYAGCCPGDKTGVCLSGASNVLAANSKSKTRVPCLFGGDESRCFDKARRSFNNRKRIDLIVDNEYNDVYGPEQTTSTVFNRVYGRFGACKPFRTQWEQTQRTV